MQPSIQLFEYHPLIFQILIEIFPIQYQENKLYQIDSYLEYISDGMLECKVQYKDIKIQIHSFFLKVQFQDFSFHHDSRHYQLNQISYLIFRFVRLCKQLDVQTFFELPFISFFMPLFHLYTFLDTFYHSLLH